jgi:hypothetical protein
MWNYPAAAGCPGRTKGGETLMNFLKWLRRFWFKLRIELEAGLNKDHK